MSESREISPDEIVVRKLDSPPEPGFDCRHPEQNTYLYERAWGDQLESISVTYQFYVHGILAGYAMLCVDGVSLGFRERGVRIRYETIGAVKLAQLGVHRGFQGQGLGRSMIEFVVTRARTISRVIGCRYVTVDARSGLDAWYGRSGFTRNKLMQDRLRRFALEKNRDPERLATSMRFDIR